jgi:hypothetical protein
MNQWTRKVVKHACDSIRRSFKSAVLDRNTELSFDYRGVYTFSRKGLVRFKPYEEGEEWGTAKPRPIGFHL